MPLAALALALAVQAQPGAPLRWQPKKGDAFTYDYLLKDKETTVQAAIKRTVKSVGRDGGYVLESRSLGAIVRIGAEEVRDDRPNVSTATYDPTGRLVGVAGGTNGLDKVRFAILTSFVAPPKPVSPGETWKVEREKDRPAGLAATTVVYTFKSVTPTAAEVAFTLTESGGAFPMSATGTWWIDLRSGVPQSLDAVVKNFAGNESGDTAFQLTLRKPG